jgi:DNA-binding beta-propeller fold protein YncE
MTMAASICALPFGRFGLLLAGALVSACTASAEDVRPPPDQLFFPSGLAVAPDNSVLFVANANSELRYDSGAISVIELDSVKKVIDGASDDGTQAIINEACHPDPEHRETLICDEAPFIRKSAGVRIGNFATDISLQNFGDKYRVIVPTRGDPSIAWADYDVKDGTLSCTAGSEHYALCDDAHRLANVQSDPSMPVIPDEPFGVFADAGPAGMANDHANGFAIVTHLINGAVTLIDSPSNGNAQIADVKANLFAPDQATGLRGATGVAGRTPGVDGDLVYVGSRTEDRIQTFTVARPVNNALPYLLPSNYFFLNAVGGNSGGSTDTRNLRFSPTGSRLYVVNRRPPSLQIYDTRSIDPNDLNGFPSNVATGASDICRQASTVAVSGIDDDERAYVTCFQDGQVYVVDPRGQSQVEDIITVGRGPYSVVAAPVGSSSFLLVSNFLEDTIAVVDVTPTSPKRNRVVLRIGKPKAP